MKAALVIGAAGFLGRNTAVALHSHRYAVSGIGHPFKPGESPRNFGVDDWMEADVTLDSLSAMRGEFDLIVHCAGSGSVGYSITHPKEDFDKTVNTTLAVLEYMRLRNRDARLIYPSSAAVYGMKPDRPIHEDDPLSPVSPYGFHKKIAEQLCESYWRAYNLRISIIRFFSLYGNGLKKQLLWEACSRFSENDKGAMFFGTGEETRDWLHVTDASNLIEIMAESSKEFDIVNGGSGQRATVREVLGVMHKEDGFRHDISFNGKSRTGDPKFYWADTNRACALGWHPSISWQEGVKAYVGWVKGMRAQP